jgi:hypothetical protein
MRWLSDVLFGSNVEMLKFVYALFNFYKKNTIKKWSLINERIWFKNFTSYGFYHFGVKPTHFFWKL